MISRAAPWIISAWLACVACGDISRGDARGSLLIVNKTDGTLAIVDPATNLVTARIPVGNQPHEIAISFDGRTAFVSDYGSAEEPGQTITMVDLESQKSSIVELAPLMRPHGMFAADDGKIYFTAEANQAFGRLDPKTRRIDWSLETGQQLTHMISAGPHGSRIITSNLGSDNISIFARASDHDQWTRTEVPVGRGPEGMDMLPGGGELWVVHSGDGGISIVDVASGMVKAALPQFMKRPNRLKFTGDGRWVLISDSANGELVMVNAASRRETGRVKVCKSLEGLLVNNSGSRVYASCNIDNYVAVIDLRSLKITGKIFSGTAPDGLAWAARS